MADEVIDWLRSREFSLAGVYNMAYDASGVAIQADFLFRAVADRALARHPGERRDPF